MAGALITKEKQYQLGNLLMGPDTPYVVQTVQGLGLPEVKGQTEENMNDDGDLLVGPDYTGSRVITVEVGIHDDAPFGDFSDIIDDLMFELGPVREGLKEFAFRLVNRGILYTNVRPKRQSGTINPLYHKGMTFLTFQLYAPKPHILDNTESTDSIVLAAAALSGQKAMAVGGTFRTKPIISIGGPARNPRVTHDEQGLAIRIDMDIQAGETLVIDAWDKTVELDGVNVYENVRVDNQWWDLLPAPNNNTIIYSRSSTGLTGASSTLTVDWHNARAGV